VSRFAGALHLGIEEDTFPMVTGTARSAGLALLLVLAAGPAAAQTSLHAGWVEIGAGWAGFPDEGVVDHAAVGGSVRLQLTPRISLGPEIVYMRGPGTDRDLFVTGNVTFDVVPSNAGRRTVVPFLVVGTGLMRHQSRFGPERFSHTEGAVTGGGGVRVRITDRLYAFGEARGGWEPHLRVTGGVGVRWP
jgi:hypothetical protein